MRCRPRRITPQVGSTARAIVSRLVALGLALSGLALAGVNGVQARPVVAAYDRFHADAASTPSIQSGLLLLNELNCVACHHAPSGWRERLPGRERIVLAGVGSRLDTEVLKQFIHAPQQIKPGTTMPAMLRGDHSSAADAISSYLSSLQRADEKRFLPGDAARGRGLFSAIGCAACHASDTTGSALGMVPVVLGKVYSRNALAAFLQNPFHTRPGGRMPAFDLSDAEAADLAAFLQAARTPVVRTETRVPDLALEVQGRTAFTAMNCAACHVDGASSVARAATPLAHIRAGHGCLAPTPGLGVPFFALDQAQTRAIVFALEVIQRDPTAPVLTAEQRLSERFAQLNCYACHEWRGAGGVEPALATHLAAASGGADSLGEPGYLPPQLDQAGRKLTSFWLEKLLWGEGGGVRPYLTIRMPKFGPQSADLVPLLAEACRPERPLAMDTSGTKGHQRSATGRVLMGTGEGGLGCVACHGVTDRNPAGVRAINLTVTAVRLQPEYFKALLLDPQGLQPGTIMPPLLAGRAHASNEVESLWTYLKELDQSPRLPEGLEVPGTFELKPEVEGRPIVFRTFLEGAGTQAIAVGNPRGPHVAFDAYEVRWALGWRGRFLDAMSNWEERAMPPVKPLGDSRHSFPMHMPLARLTAATDPWPTTHGASAGYSFHGYHLEADGVPVFRYRVGEVEVEDVIRPDGAGGALLRRLTLRLTGDRDSGWFFRGLTRDRLPRIIEWINGVAIIEEELQW